MAYKEYLLYPNAYEDVASSYNSLFSTTHRAIKSQHVIRKASLDEVNVPSNTDILGVRLFVEDPPNMNIENFRIGLAHTTKEVHNREEGFIPDSEYTFVSLTPVLDYTQIQPDSAVEFIFDQPFQWNGIDNLSVYIARERTAGSYVTSGGRMYRKQSSNENMIVFGYTSSLSSTESYPYPNISPTETGPYVPKMAFLTEDITPSDFEIVPVPIETISSISALVGTYEDLGQVELFPNPIENSSTFQGKLSEDITNGIVPVQIVTTSEISTPSLLKVKYFKAESIENYSELSSSIGIFQAEDFIIIRDYQNNSFITKMYNILDPVIYEQINERYEFTFQTVADGNLHYLANKNNMVEIENNYFRISRIKKQRGLNGSFVDVAAEHISYELNTEIELESISGTPYSIITTLLSGTRFKLGRLDFTSTPIEYKPKEKTRRGLLLELANYLGGELLFGKFEIHLLTRRGNNKGLSFEVGENIIGITADIDFTEEGRSAYEVDVLDLAHLPEYQHLATARLGDDISISDPQLQIADNLRVISHEYDPFNKALPKIQLGHIIRDLSDYVKDLEEEDGIDGEEISFDEYMFEFGKGELLPEQMNFAFKSEYDEVLSITTGIIGEKTTSGTTLIANPILNTETNKYSGVSVMPYGQVPEGLQISIQAVCFNAAKEDTEGVVA